jgi:hypothetical protein
MTLEELETFNDSHLFKLAAEKFTRMSELHEKGANAEDINPYLIDIKYILYVLQERNVIDYDLK